MGRPAIPATAFDHGDVRRYNRGCRCADCIKAAAIDRSRQRYLRQTGRGSRTAPDLAAGHILRLRATGLTDGEIQRAGQVVPDVFYAILRGARSIHRTTEARVLAIPVPAAPITGRNCARTPGIGTWRRMQTLAAQGWSAGELGRRLGKSKQHALYLMQPTASGLVRQRVADEVRDLYHQLHRLKPEENGVAPHYAQQARGRAAGNGWPTADYWDDDDFDNPDFQPAVTVHTNRITVVAEDAGWLLETGHSTDHVAERLGISRGYMLKAIAAARSEQAAA